MIRSMTGFGEAERVVSSGRLRVEIRTVNHRYFHLTVRGPSGTDALSSTMERWMRQHLTRGHVQVNVALSGQEGEARPRLELDLDRAREYREGLVRLQEELGLEGEVGLDLFVGFSDLFRKVEEDRDLKLEVEPLREAVTEACQAVTRMRDEEGDRLRHDLEGRLDALEARLGEVEERAPTRLVEERDRLRAAIRELTEGVGVDEERIAREIAHLAERWDISEELVRFQAHVDAFRDALDEEAEKAVGKRLGFLVQELLRETNTIGSKANDTRIGHSVVAMKEEIERLREQVENVE